MRLRRAGGTPPARLSKPEIGPEFGPQIGADYSVAGPRLQPLPGPDSGLDLACRRHARQAQRRAGIQRHARSEFAAGFPLARFALAGMTMVAGMMTALGGLSPAERVAVTGAPGSSIERTRRGDPPISRGDLPNNERPEGHSRAPRAPCRRARPAGAAAAAQDGLQAGRGVRVAGLAGGLPGGGARQPPAARPAQGHRPRRRAAARQHAPLRPRACPPTTPCCGARAAWASRRW